MRIINPATIYLQPDDGECQTWCEDRINLEDTEYIRKDIYDNSVATLTEQLRLANEDAERLAEYVGHKRTCTWAVVRSDVKPKCDCKLSDALRLHKKRITQESE